MPYFQSHDRANCQEGVGDEYGDCWDRLELHRPERQHKGADERQEEQKADGEHARQSNRDGQDLLIDAALRLRLLGLARQMDGERLLLFMHPRNLRQDGIGIGRGGGRLLSWAHQ